MKLILESEFLKDKSNKKSIKRLIGCILMANGIFLKNVEWFLAIFKEVANSSIMSRVSDDLLWTGAGLIGISIAEHIADKFKK